MNVLYTLIFLPVILFIGIVTSYQDFKLGRIKNIWIILGIIYGIFAYIGLSFSGSVDFKIIFSNFMISLLLGFMLWKFNLWAAGDAKLFLVYSLLIPPPQYRTVYIKYFPSLSLAINIFLPATIFLFLGAALYFFKKITFSGLCLKAKELLRQKGVGFIIGFCGFGSVFLFKQIFTPTIFKLFPIFASNGKLLFFILIFLAYRQFYSLFKKINRWTILVFLLSLIYFFIHSFSLGQVFFFRTAEVVRDAILIMIIYSSFTLLIDLYAKKINNNTWSFANWVFIGVLITWFGIF